MFLKNKILVTIAIALVANLSLVFGQNQQPVIYGQPSSNLKFVTERTHEVQSGDNAWDLASETFYNGFLWRDVVKMNPWLEDGRTREKWYDKSTGFWYCQLFPGEVISLGYHETQPDLVVSEPVQKQIPVAKVSGTEFPWTYLFFLLFFIGLIYLFFLHKEKKDRTKKEQEKKKEEEEAIRLADLKKREEEKAIRLAESDPIGSGAPQVKGGVTDEQAIARAISIASGINGVNPRFLNVTNIERGRLFGKGETFYADKPNGLTKRFSGEVGYRGTVSRLDGTEQIVFFLQACGNDVRQGEYMEGINFVADQEQPELFSQHNNAVEIQKEGSAPVKLFDWRERVFDTIDKGTEKQSKFFFHIKIGDSEMRFDTLNEKENKKPAKGN